MSPNSVENTTELPCNAGSPSCGEGSGFVQAIRSLKLVAQAGKCEGVVCDDFNPDITSGFSCEGLQRQWKAFWCREGGSEGKRILRDAYVKGTRSIFDFQCDACTSARYQAATDAFIERVTRPGNTPSFLLKDVRERVRYLLKSGKGNFWSEWKGEKDHRYRVPDLNGCLEATRCKGGTFSVPKQSFLRGDEGQVVEIAPILSKGKIRVVTKQAVYYKTVLDAPAEAAYDWLSNQEWLIRGDVKVEDYQRLTGKAPFVSGDYSAATDNLNLDLVIAVIEEIGSFLPKRLGEALRNSFSNLEVTADKNKRGFKLVRGSLMGSRMSFVVLCLINRVLFDISQGVRTFKTPEKPVLINGDDIAFRATSEEVDRWEFFCQLGGFVVNRQKTHISCRYVEINSQPFDSQRQRLMKKPTFGIFSKAEIPSWDSLLKLRHQLSWKTFTWFCSQQLVVERIRHARPTPGLFNRGSWGFFVKKRWFRESLTIPEGDSEQAPEGQSGYKGLEYCRGPVLPASEELIVRAAEREYIRGYIKYRRGQNNRSTGKLREKPSCRPIRAERNLMVEVHRTWLRPVLEMYLSTWNEIAKRPPGAINITIEANRVHELELPPGITVRRGWHHSRVPDYRPIYSNARFVENRGEYIFKPNTESWIRVGQVWTEW
jgi:hypothetical protein